MAGSISRPFSFVLIVSSFFAIPGEASAVERPHFSRGRAQLNGTDFVGSGLATHLGVYSETGTVTFTPTSDPAVLHLEATATYTAASGDELYATFTGQFNLLTGAITATVTYEGGTGLFEEATGTANLRAQALPDGSITVTVKGTIDY